MEDKEYLEDLEIFKNTYPDQIVAVPRDVFMWLWHDVGKAQKVFFPYGQKEGLEKGKSISFIEVKRFKASKPYYIVQESL